MTEQQRQHRDRLAAAELALAKRQEVLEAYDLVLLDLKDNPGVHGYLPSLRSLVADGVQKLARFVAELKAAAPP